MKRVPKALRGEKPSTEEKPHRLSETQRMRVGQGQHKVILRYPDFRTGKMVEELFETGPLAAAAAHSRSIPHYEIVDA